MDFCVILFYVFLLIATFVWIIYVLHSQLLSKKQEIENLTELYKTKLHELRLRYQADLDFLRKAQALRHQQELKMLHDSFRSDAAMFEEFDRLNGVSKGTPKQQFTADELKTLINLCHPDKHGGKSSATEITKKLLAMRS